MLTAYNIYFFKKKIKKICKFYFKDILLRSQIKGFYKGFGPIAQLVRAPDS